MVSLQRHIKFGRVKRAEVGTTSSAGPRPSLPMATPLQGIPVCPSAPHCNPREHARTPMFSPGDPLPQGPRCIPIHPFTTQYTPVHLRMPQYTATHPGGPLPQDPHCFLCTTMQTHVPHFPPEAPSPRTPLLSPASQYTPVHPGVSLTLPFSPAPCG